MLYGRVRRAVNDVLLVFDDFLGSVVGTVCWQVMWRCCGSFGENDIKVTKRHQCDEK